MTKTATKIVVMYTLFAVVSTAANIAFYVKYQLDKKYVFVNNLNEVVS